MSRDMSVPPVHATNIENETVVHGAGAGVGVAFTPLSLSLSFTVKLSTLVSYKDCPDEIPHESAVHDTTFTSPTITSQSLGLSRASRVQQSVSPLLSVF